MIDGCSGGDDALFDVQKVADGVHVAVAARAYKVNCNTALIETDDGVLVVDSHSKPSAARVVVERLREITRKPVRYVVNTYFHWDHWQGNEAYPSAYGHVEVIGFVGFPGDRCWSPSCTSRSGAMVRGPGAREGG
jgi:glyoxylase-like metal-dependent hydrolase (beta-lactamase superfamily II)